MPGGGLRGVVAATGTGRNTHCLFYSLVDLLAGKLDSMRFGLHANVPPKHFLSVCVESGVRRIVNQDPAVTRVTKLSNPRTELVVGQYYAIAPLLHDVLV